MTPNQLQLLTNLVYSFHAQIDEKERIKLSRAAFSDRAKEFGGEIYSKILHTIITQNIFDHLKTAALDKPQYWAELILELIHAKCMFGENFLEEDVKTHYTYWENYKVQNNFKLLTECSSS